MDAIAKPNPSLADMLPTTYTELSNDLLTCIIRIFNSPALNEEDDDNWRRCRAGFPRYHTKIF